MGLLSFLSRRPEDPRPGYRKTVSCPYCQKNRDAFDKYLRAMNGDRAIFQAARKEYDESGYWHVHVQDFPLRVYPLNGGVTVEGRGLSPGWGKFRYQYPKTADQLREAIAACWKWCDKENAKEERDRALAKEVARG